MSHAEARRAAVEQRHPYLQTWHHETERTHIGWRETLQTNDAMFGHDVFVETFLFDEVLSPIPLFFRIPSLQHNFEIRDRLIGRVESLAAHGTSP